MNHSNVYRHKGGESMQCSKVGKAMYHLVVIGALVSALALVGCGGGGGDNGSGDNGSGTTTTSNVANVPDTAVPANATTVQAQYRKSHPVPVVLSADHC